MKLIYERSQAGRRASSVPDPGLEPGAAIPEHLQRSQPPRLPEMAEPELVRHFTELSTRINLLLALPLDKLDRLSLKRKLDEIGRSGGEARAR